MSAWVGDLAELGRLADNIDRLASIPSKAARGAAAGIAEAIDQQFELGIDPYGKPWQPLADATIEKKGGDSRILQETDRLREGISVKPTSGAGIAVSIDAEYAGFHQTGNEPSPTQPNGMPARKILPEGPMPDTWERAISDALDAAFEKEFG